MTTVLYNDYKMNYNEYMKTVLYTEKILHDSNSDQNKLIKIYEKAIKSAENMFKRMQLEVETNPLLRNKYDEFNEMQNEIAECKRKLRMLKEEIVKKDQRNIETNNCDDRIYLLNDVDLLEKGDVYINQSKILMDNAEYIGNDVMRNLNTQKENIKRNIKNVSFVSNNLESAKQIMKNLKYKEALNKYRLYIIYLFIVLTFVFIAVVKYNRHFKNKDVSPFQMENEEHNAKSFASAQDMNNEVLTDGTVLSSVGGTASAEEQTSSIVYDFISSQDINETRENASNENIVQENKKEISQDTESKNMLKHHEGNGLPTDNMKDTTVDNLNKNANTNVTNKQGTGQNKQHENKKKLTESK